MPVFNVVICRVTADEVTVRVEAPSLEVITEECLCDEIYEATDRVRKLRDWEVVENSVDIDAERVVESDHPPELILRPRKKDAHISPWRAVKAPKRPYVDPRQVNLPLKEKA